MTLNPKTCNSDPETSSTPERILPHLCFEAGSETEGVLAALAAGHVEVVRLQYEFKADEHLGATGTVALQLAYLVKLGRPLGYFIFSLIGLKRTLLTTIFQRLQRGNQESCQEVLLLLLAKASAESEEKGPDKEGMRYPGAPNSPK